MALADVRGARRSFFYSSGTRPAVVASSGAPVSGRAACDSATEALAGPRIRRRPGDGPAARFGETARRANPGSMPPSATGGEAGLSASSTRSLAGEGAWEGLGLLAGSSITDIATLLTLFCTQCGPGNWAAVLRQELPGLTDADITWLCGLTEEMEPFEPQPSRATLHLSDILDGSSHEFSGSCTVDASRLCSF